MLVNPVSGASTHDITSLQSTAARSSLNFEAMLRNAVESANRAQGQNDIALESLLSGKTDSVHEVVLNMAKAEMSFAFMMEVRNRVVETYHDLMRMQV